MATITATAIPSKNYHFVGWSDGLLSPARPALDLSTLAADTTLTANFALAYDLVYNVDETVGGTVVQTGGASGAAITQSVLYGTDAVTVTATPSAGYYFVSWSDGVNTAARTDKTVISNITVTASFSQSRKLTYVARAGGGIDTSTAKIVSQYGAASATATEVEAKPATGYHFTGWSDGVKTAKRTDSFANIVVTPPSGTFAAGSCSVTVYANFAQAYNINYNTNDGSSSAASTVGGSIVFG